MIQGQCVPAAVFCKNRSYSRQRCGDRHGIEHHQQRFALQLGGVGGGLFQVEYDTGPIAGLHDTDRLQIALVDLDGGSTHGTCDAWKIKCNSGRRLDCEPGRNSCQRLRQIDFDDLNTALN